MIIIREMKCQRLNVDIIFDVFDVISSTFFSLLSSAWSLTFPFSRRLLRFCDLQLSFVLSSRETQLDPFFLEFILIFNKSRADFVRDVKLKWKGKIG